MGAGGGDHREVALYRFIAAVKAVRILVSDFVMPLCTPFPPVVEVAGEKAECR